MADHLAIGSKLLLPCDARLNCEWNLMELARSGWSHEARDLQSAGTSSCYSLPYKFSVIQSAYLLPKPRLSDYPPVADPHLYDYTPVPEPCCRTLACPTTRLFPNPVAEPSPVRLHACSRTLLPNPRLSDYPPVAEPSPVRLPACCRTPACPTTCLLPNPRLSDYLPVAEPSPVRLPACCRTLACLTTRLLPNPRLPDYRLSSPAGCYSMFPINTTSFHPISASLCPAFDSLVLSL